MIENHCFFYSQVIWDQSKYQLPWVKQTEEKRGREEIKESVWKGVPFSWVLNFNKAIPCHGILSSLELSHTHSLTLNTHMRSPVPDMTGSDRCQSYTRKLQQDMFTVTHMVSFPLTGIVSWALLCSWVHSFISRGSSISCWRLMYLEINCSHN